MGEGGLACNCEETCESVWPPNASLYASSACVHLRLLAGPFGQGLRKNPPEVRVPSGQNLCSEIFYIVSQTSMGLF